MAFPSDHSSPTVVVFENRPRWGPELQRQLARTGIVVRECRSLRDLLPTTRDVPSSIIIMDLDAAPAECLTWFSQTFPCIGPPPVLIVASAQLADLEWPLRESGAMAFVDDEISGARLAQLCLRQFRLNTTPVRESGFSL